MTIEQEKAKLDEQISNLRDNASTLIASPEGFSQAILDLLDQSFLSSESFEDLFSFYQGLFEFGDDQIAIPTTTETRIQQQQNRDSIFELVKAGAIAAASKAASQISYTSTDEAKTARALILTEISKRLFLSTGDEVFKNLKILSTKTSEALPPPNQKLLDILDLEIKRTIPSLVLAWELYEDAEQDFDIVDRNKIRHPGFIKAGSILKVLSSV